MRFSKTTLVCALLFVLTAIGAASLLLRQPTGVVAGVTVQNYAAVPANPYNQAAQQIERKQSELQSKQAALEENYSRQNRFLLYLLIAMGAMLVLTIINIYIDFKRRHSVIAN